MVAHCAVIITVPVPGDEDAILALWCEKTLQRIAMWQQTTDTRHWAPACWHLNNVGLASKTCQLALRTFLSGAAGRHTTQHSNMILRSESRRAVLVSSSIKATSHNISLERAPNVNSSWWQVWASVLVIWSGLCWGEELMVSINTIIRTLLRRGRGFYSRGSLGAYRWVNASNH